MVHAAKEQSVKEGRAPQRKWSIMLGRTQIPLGYQQ